MTDRRVRFDFEVDFLNGGGLQGHDFRLDIDGDDITDDELAEAIVRDLRLLMVGAVRIRDKAIIEEAHKRADAPQAPSAPESRRLVDLSHPIDHGMETYRGLPGPVIEDHLSREASRSIYAPGTEFHIGRITMVANTGTYLDAPAHRFAGGSDVAGLPLSALANLEGIVVRVAGSSERAIPASAFGADDVRGRAVLVHTGWDRHWRTEAYFTGHPFLTADAAAQLRDSGAALVGIDSLNIDDTDDGSRPAHTTLLAAGIPIVEHLRGLDQLPVRGFRFFAVPAPVRGMGTFPARAFAVLGVAD
ncbi:MAG TPA: cyclase family protein [Candidatus Angelobacter sp.]|nr:cyclase family protein [Candidatus Angelobacter sp.]